MSLRSNCAKDEKILKINSPDALVVLIAPSHNDLGSNEPSPLLSGYPDWLATLIKNNERNHLTLIRRL
jgi:hypothetical protein